MPLSLVIFRYVVAQLMLEYALLTTDNLGPVLPVVAALVNVNVENEYNGRFISTP
jgi:hypothetical protein